MMRMAARERAAVALLTLPFRTAKRFVMGAVGYAITVLTAVFVVSVCR
jgi:type IV secretion system protein VirD4